MENIIVQIVRTNGDVFAEKIFPNDIRSSNTIKAWWFEVCPEGTDWFDKSDYEFKIV